VSCHSLIWQKTAQNSKWHQFNLTGYLKANTGI
jgi:hypothetical protein